MGLGGPSGRVQGVSVHEPTGALLLSDAKAELSVVNQPNFSRFRPVLTRSGRQRAPPHAEHVRHRLDEVCMQARRLAGDFALQSRQQRH